MATRPRARPDLTVYEIDDELVIYDPKTGGVHHLNQTGALVFRLCDGTATVRETIAEIADAFGARAEDTGPQVRAIVAELRSRDLLDRKRGGEAGTQPDERGDDERERIRLQVPRTT